MAKTKTKSKTLNKKPGFKFQWWMGFVLIALVAVVGVAILRFSNASGGLSYTAGAMYGGDCTYVTGAKGYNICLERKDQVWFRFSFQHQKTYYLCVNARTISGNSKSIIASYFSTFEDTNLGESEDWDMPKVKSGWVRSNNAVKITRTPSASSYGDYKDTVISAYAKTQDGDVRFRNIHLSEDGSCPG